MQLLFQRIHVDSILWLVSGLWTETSSVSVVSGAGKTIY